MSKIIGITAATPLNPNSVACGGLPKVTEEDNGKFLRVVDCAIALVSLQDVSKEGM